MGDDPFPISVRAPHGPTRRGFIRSLRAAYEDNRVLEDGETVGFKDPDEHERVDEWGVKCARMYHNLDLRETVIRLPDEETARLFAKEARSHAGQRGRVWWTPQGANMLRRMADEALEPLQDGEA